jgi:hypothetical protein
MERALVTISNKKLACGAEHKPVPETTATARCRLARARNGNPRLTAKALSF